MPVADAQRGAPYTAAVPLADANGSPLSGAVTAGGTLNVYGPASATVAVATGTAADLGGGRYGIALTGADLATDGFYRFTIPTITVGGRTFVDQGGWFRVGDIPPEYRPLRHVLQQVLVAAGMAVASTSTALGTTTTLVDTRWLDAGLATGEFVGDELLILEPGAAADTNPVRVTGFAPGTGTLTFAPAVAGATASGTDYLLIRASEQGDRYAQARAVVDDAVADLARREVATDSATLTTTTNTVDYALPAGFLTVEQLEYDPRRGVPYAEWRAVAPAYWQHYPDRGTLHFAAEVLPWGTPLRVTGKVAPPAPRALSDLVPAPATAVIDQAAGLLALPRQQRAGPRLGRAARGLRQSAGW